MLHEVDNPPNRAMGLWRKKNIEVDESTVHPCDNLSHGA